MERSDFQNVLLAVVGGYLIYLAYQLFTGLPTVETRRMFIIMVIASVVFAAVGVFVIIRSIYFIWKKHRANPDVNNPEENYTEENITEESITKENITKENNIEENITEENNTGVNKDIHTDDKNSTD